MSVERSCYRRLQLRCNELLLGRAGDVPPFDRSAGVEHELRALGAKLAWLLRRTKDLRLNMMVEFVKQLVIRVLVRDPDADFDIHMTLTDMGMDSLMVRELSNMLGKQIGKKLSVTLDYDYPNVAAIAAFLLSGLKITDVVAIAEALAPAPTPKADKIERPISRPQNRY